MAEKPEEKLDPKLEKEVEATLDRIEALIKESEKEQKESADLARKLEQ